MRLNKSPKLYSVAFISTLLLSACATAPKPPTSTNLSAYQQHANKLKTVSDFELTGKLGVIYQKKGFSGGITWQHQPSADTINVLSPLGSKVAIIQKSPTHVTLTDNKGRVVEASDVESLTQKTLGWQLPLVGLSDWILGKSSPSSIVDSYTWDASGRLQTLNQDGWTVEYMRYVDYQGLSLPSKLRIKNERVNLKLIIKRWH